MMITVFLRNTNGKGQKLHIEQKCTVQHLLTVSKDALNANNEKNNKHEFQAYFRGVNLNDQINQEIEQLGIQANSIIHIVQQRVRRNQPQESLRVKLIIEGRLFEYQLRQNEKVQYLKQTICEDLDIKDEEDLTLSFLGVELDNTRTIVSYQFQQDVLISAKANTSINFVNYRKAYTMSKESYSQESEGVPKIIRQDPVSPRRRVKKTESMNVENSPVQNKLKAIFQSVQLKKIEEKVDESRNDSIINQSQEIEEILQIDQGIQLKVTPAADWPKPKLTLDLLGKSGNQNIIETESIMGDDQQESIYVDCIVQFVRTDRLREYTFECSQEDTFQSVSQMLAKLERVDVKFVKLLINFDQVSKSAMSNRSGRGPMKAPQSPQSQRIIKKHKSYLLGRGSMILNPQKENELKLSIVQWASRIKNRQLSIQYQILKLA